MFLSGACAWATPSTLATLSSWRRFLLATLSLGDAFFLGDAFSWQRLLSWRRLSPLRTEKR